MFFPLETLKALKPGDKVLFRLDPITKFEEIESIEHDYHPYRESENIYCQINDSYWYYSDIGGIVKSID